MNKKISSTALLFLTAIVWGFAFVAQAVGAQFMGTLSYNGIRFLLGACSLIPVVLIFDRQKYSREKIKMTVLIGFVGGFVLFAASNLQQYGIEITNSAGKAGFLTGLYTVLVPIFSLLLFKKRTNILTWFGVAFALSGLYLLCFTGTQGFGLGDILLIIGAFFWAAHIIVIDRFVSKISPLRFAFVQFLTCGTLSIVGALLFETIEYSAVKAALIPILYGGLMSVGVAYTCQILGQKNADPTFAAIVLSTESVFSVIGAAIILNERMTLAGYIGCSLIFCGIILSQLNFNFKRKRKTVSAVGKVQ